MQFHSMDYGLWTMDYGLWTIIRFAYYIFHVSVKNLRIIYCNTRLYYICYYHRKS